MDVVDATSNRLSYGSLRKRNDSVERKSILKRKTDDCLLDDCKNGSYQRCVDSAFGSDELNAADQQQQSKTVTNTENTDDEIEPRKPKVDYEKLRSLTLPKSANRTTSRKSCLTNSALLPYHQNYIKSDDQTGSSTNVVKFKPFTLQEKISWISNHEHRGFIRVFDPMSNLQCSVVVPCTINTTAQQICTKLGISPNDLHLQLNGELIRRLDRFDKPLTLQHNYLESIGFDNIVRQQELGDNLDLGYLIRFFAGRPSFDDGFGRQPLNCYCHVRKGRVFHQWSRRLCVLNSSRLLIYPDLDRSGNPDVVILSRAKVEEIHLRSRGRCIKITVTPTRRPMQTIYLAFDAMVDLNAWLARCVKAAAKIPPISDLSNLQLECLPEQVFCVGSDRLLTQLNLKHNFLKERPPNEDMFSLGWLDDLPRFQSLRSLNLADNDLGHFPAAILLLPAVTELNLAGNKLLELPSQISKLRNLQILNVQNNLLARLPSELSLCDVLANFDLSFNRFVSIPEVITRLKSLEHWVLNGNQIAQLPTDTALACMGHVKKIELRHCDLRLTVNDGIPVATLPYLTHLDIRDNCNVTGVDLRSLHSLQTINCQRCSLTMLQLNGTALTYVYASRNKLSNVVIMPVPRHLKVFDVSRNELTKIPEWLTELSKIEKIVASHNNLTTVPHRLFTNVSSLKYLQLNHNEIRSLPSQIENCFIEVLLLHHNRISSLPSEFLASTHKLKILNLSQNSLQHLPPLNPFLDLNKVQQLFLSCNRLSDDVVRIISGYRRMRVLDLAYNLIRNIENCYIDKLQFLEEINLSRNKLISLPPAFVTLPKLTVLRAHSNRLTTIPDFSFCSNLKVLDVAANQLEIVDVRYFLAPQLKHLDVACNTRLQLNTTSFQQMNSHRLVSLIDMSREIHAPHTTSTEVPWQAGFSETSGERNKLCISQLRHPIFDSNEGDALFGMIDGGLNNEIPLHLQSKLPEILKNERKHPATGISTPPSSSVDYVKYTLLNAHKSLQSRGQKMGASCTLCHIIPYSSGAYEANDDARYVLYVANSGHTEAVLCRRGSPIVLTQRYIVDEFKDEYDRIRMAGSIVTEDNEIDGITPCSRLLGCNFLYPAVIPEPHTFMVELGEPDEFLLIASRGLWEQMDYAEAVRRIRYIPNPILAAKHLQDVVQSYGFKENLSVLVVRFFFNSHNDSILDANSAFPPPPFVSQQRRLAQVGQAASAVNIHDDCSSTLTSDDEIRSEPLGRKLREQPNYYFEYKKKLKELMLDDSTSSCTPVSSCSLNTLIAEHHNNNNGDVGHNDDERIRLDDGYQSSEAATPGPLIDLDEVQAMETENIIKKVYGQSLSTNTVDGEVHDSNDCRLDPVYLMNCNGSDGSSSSSGLGTIKTNSPQRRSVDKSLNVFTDLVVTTSTTTMTAKATNSEKPTEQFDEVTDSKLRFQLARQQVMQKLHFSQQNLADKRQIIPIIKNTKNSQKIDPLKLLKPVTINNNEIGFKSEQKKLLSSPCPETCRDDSSTASPIYDLPFHLKNRIYQTIDGGGVDEEVQFRNDLQSNSYTWEFMENTTEIKQFQKMPLPAPPKTVSVYGLGTLGRRSLVIANIDIDEKCDDKKSSVNGGKDLLVAHNV